MTRMLFEGCEPTAMAKRRGGSRQCAAFVCVASACLSFLVAADPAPATETSPATFAAAQEALMRNRPLAAVQILRDGQREGTIPDALVDQFITAVIEPTCRAPSASDRQAQPVADSRALPAIAAIVRAARGRRVVMLNEDHTHQQHRAFALQLLRALRRAGFTHFAAETFNVEAPSSMLDGAPDMQTGVYLFDPFFADLARQAAAQGFMLVPYEVRPDQELNSGTGEERRLVRETAQANNLADVLSANESSRVFVYAGAGHITEASEGDGRTWMAEILAKRTGIDPLTVNQDRGTAPLQGTPSHSRYRSITQAHALREPFVVVAEDGFLTDPGFDMIVFHPQVGCVDGRPEWQLMAGYRKRCPLKIEPSAEPTLIRAFVAGESPGSIAMDQVLLPAGTARVTLLLPAGRYRITRQGELQGRSVGMMSVASGEPRAGQCQLTEAHR